MSRGRKSRRISKNEEEEGLILKMIPEDMLGEILIRVWDSKTAILSASVCKAWRSVVSSPEFVPAFIRKHSQSSSSSYTMFVQFRLMDETDPEQTYYCYSDKVLTVEGRSEVAADPAETLLHEIVPDLRLESTCHDLMLVATLSGSEYCVCRPASRQRYVIPSLSPLHEHGGFRALAARRGFCDFRILHIGVAAGRCHTAIFSSETGRWSEPLRGPSLRRRSDVVATSDGRLFWVDDFRQRRAVVFDPFGGTDAWYNIPLPYDMATDESGAYEFAPPGELSVYGSDKFRVCVGAVQGRVRISQLFRVPRFGSFVLLVWELEEDDTWRLVHAVQVGPGVDTKWMYPLALDPDDGDVVFLCSDSDVYRYRIGKDDSRRVFRLSCSMDSISQDLLPRYARAAFITRPVWPAAVPAFESAKDDIFFF